MSVILIVWTIIAVTPGGHEYKDWRLIGEFRSPASCVEAAKQMDAKNYRCLLK